MAKLGSLFVSLIADTAQFSSGLAKAQRDVNSTGAAINRGLATIDKSFASLGRSINSFGAGLFSLKGAAAALIGVGAGGGLVAMAKQALETVGGLGELASQIGVTTGLLQTMTYAGSQFGLSAEEAQGSLAKLTATIGQAAEGGKAQIELFDRLGIKILDTAGKVRSTDEVFRDLVEALSRIEDPATRAALAKEAMGRAAQRMMPLIEGGTAALDAMTKQAREMGLVFDQETIARADEAADKLATLSQVLGTQFNAALVELAPALTAVANGILDISKGIRGTLDNFKSIDAIGLDRLTEKLEALQKKRDELIQSGATPGLKPKVSGSWGADSLWEWLTKSSNDTTRIGTPDQQLADVNAEIAQIMAIIRRRRDAMDALGASGGGGATNPAGGDGTKAKTAAVREQTSALDELLANMARELELSKETDRQRAISEALIRASAAAQRDYDAGLRDSPLVDPATVERIKATTGALFDQSEAQRKVGAAAQTSTRAVKDATESARRYESAMAQLGGTFGSAFEDAAIAMNTADNAAAALGDTLKGLLQDIERVILRLTVTDPIVEGLTGILKDIDWSRLFGPGKYGVSSGKMQSSGGGGGWFSDFFSWLGFHGGGIAGGRPTFTRRMPASAFAGAPRLHGGGFIGPGEVPAILKRGEGVFTAEQMANLAPAGGDAQPVIINVVTPPGGSAETRESTGPNGQKQIDIMIKDSWERTAGRGGFDKSLGANFGMKRRPGKSS
ncbi:phage tail tape measure protein [Dongia sp.]|uniref:phage tail tape measure protein n=1 Tax=Dongia sp. TaxID=1977262 RepID=UPI0037503446